MFWRQKLKHVLWPAHLHAVYKVTEVYRLSCNKQEELKEYMCNESLDMIKIIFQIYETLSISVTIRDT
jgi:hypothetical protein